MNTDLNFAESNIEFLNFEHPIIFLDSLMRSGAALNLASASGLFASFKYRYNNSPTSQTRRNFQVNPRPQFYFWVCFLGLVVAVDLENGQFSRIYSDMK